MIQQNHLQNKKMIGGYLTEKRGIFQMVLLVPDPVTGKVKKTWKSTGLKVKGNKKRAEDMLTENRILFGARTYSKDGAMLFADYMEDWLKAKRPSIERTTYSGYAMIVDNVVSPYFRERGILLCDLTVQQLNIFYSDQQQRVTGCTALKYHNVMHNALKKAVREGVIPMNPADFVDRPQKSKYVADHYTSDQLNELLEAVKGTYLEIPVLFAGFYGLRRGEIIGLKWSAFDFQHGMFTVKHTYNEAYIDGKIVEIPKNRAKNKASLRSLPLILPVQRRLKQLKKQQEEYKRLCGNKYDNTYSEYVCVDPLGKLTRPNKITCGFKAFLEKNGFDKIRFHDLRHTCASILLANGVQMKQIQEYLGHSDFSTTANLYAHLEQESKQLSVATMQEKVCVNY